MQRDVPEPALLILDLQDDGRPFIAAGVAVGALRNRSTGHPFSALDRHSRSLSRLAISELWPLASTTTWARTSHFRPSSSMHSHADGPLAFEQNFQHAHAFVDVDALFAGVLEHHLVELAAQHLPGLRALVRLVVEEIERLRQLAAGLTNCTLYFLTKRLAFILSSMPSRWSTQYVSGISDSPIWNRGKCSRRTIAPDSRAGEQGRGRRADGPPPMTMTWVLSGIGLESAIMGGIPREVTYRESIVLFPTAAIRLVRPAHGLKQFDQAAELHGVHVP